MIIKIVVLMAFALMNIVVGVIGLRKTKSFSDYFLGGGKIGPLMTAFTYGAAYFSAVLFIGFAGKIGWEFGLSSLWIAAGNSLVGVLAVWWLMGERIKKMSIEYGVSTLPEYLEKRYDCHLFKLYASIMIFIFFIPYSAAVFIGLSYLFQANFNIQYGVALLFMGGFTGFYLVLGGYRSMTIIDVLFGMIMAIGAMALLASVIGKAGGIAPLAADLAAIDRKLTGVVGPPGLWPLFSLVFLTSVAPFAMPQLVQKFYAIRDRKAIRTGMIASTAFSILITGTAYFVGAAARCFLSAENAPAAFRDGRPIFDALMPTLLANVVPPSLAILMLLLILSASMSTLAALVLISSSSLAKDVYSGFINRRVSDRGLTLLMRVSAVFFVCLSVILAYSRPASIVAILGISWGAIGSTFLGPFFWGLTSKKVNKIGAISSSLGGLATCIVLYFAGQPSPQAGTVGMLVSLAANPLISAAFDGRTSGKSV